MSNRAAARFYPTFPEDGSCTILGRITARNGTGESTGNPGEGRFIKQADLSEILCYIYDLGVSAETPSFTPTVTISSVILDTPDTTDEIWTADGYGCNFTHDLLPEYFPTGGNKYCVEYKFTTTGGTVFWASFEGPAWPVRSS